MFTHQAIPNGAPQVLSEVTVATGTATALTATATTDNKVAKVGVWVQSLAANTAKIYVGPSGVTTSTGAELAPGDSVFYPIGRPENLYAISGTSSQKLHVWWV